MVGGADLLSTFDVDERLAFTPGHRESGGAPALSDFVDAPTAQRLVETAIAGLGLDVTVEDRTAALDMAVRFNGNVYLFEFKVRSTPRRRPGGDGAPASPERFARRFESALADLSEGLSKPRTQKRLNKVTNARDSTKPDSSRSKTSERNGDASFRSSRTARFHAGHRGCALGLRTRRPPDDSSKRPSKVLASSRSIAQHYDIELDSDKCEQRATAVHSPAR